MYLICIHQPHYLDVAQLKTQLIGSTLLKRESRASNVNKTELRVGQPGLAFLEANGCSPLLCSYTKSDVPL